jgi:DNA polymerase-1
MIASYLLDATRSEHPLEDLALEHTSYKALTEEDVCGRGAKAVSLADVPVEAAVDYAGERADIAGQLPSQLCKGLLPGALVSWEREVPAMKPSLE